jgi:hypothetical protein
MKKLIIDKHANNVFIFRPELAAGFGHGVPYKAAHHLYDLLSQEGRSVVMCFINM